MDVFVGRQVYYGVIVLVDCLYQFFYFFGDVGGYCVVVDVGVDFGQEVVVDDYWFVFWMVDVVGQYGLVMCDFVVYEFGGDDGWD